MSSWQNAAACRDVDTELFFPAGTTGEAAGQIDAAKRVCAGCDVREACLEYAIETNQTYGVWGGYDEQERKRLRRKRVRAQRTAA